ncbi:uncharacterized protein [Ptychodera flava]|uniref:uncharacterized protein n=1 Tax=Ptychodera flava TaxID=63121 RepID=UPI00396A6DFE
MNRQAWIPRGREDLWDRTCMIQKDQERRGGYPFYSAPSHLLLEARAGHQWRDSRQFPSYATDSPELIPISQRIQALGGQHVGVAEETTVSGKGYKPKCPQSTWTLQATTAPSTLQATRKAMDIASQKATIVPPEKQISTPSLTATLVLLLLLFLILADWELVFKAVSGAGGNVLDLWNSDGGRNEDNERAKDLSSKFRDHYKNSIIDNWSAIGVKQVKVAIYDECGEVMYMTFNGEGSDKNDWFSKDRLTSTSYTDLDSNSQTNYFSIPGHDSVSRHFFVNQNYGGCEIDVGWLVVVDTGNTSCDWSEMKRRPYFLYGSAGQKITYQSGSDDVATGRSFAVFIKT